MSDLMLLAGEECDGGANCSFQCTCLAGFTPRNDRECEGFCNAEAVPTGRLEGCACITRHGDTLDFDGAEARCQGLGGHLLSLHSQREGDLAAALHDSRGRAPAWIGLNDRITKLRAEYMVKLEEVGRLGSESSDVHVWELMRVDKALLKVPIWKAGHATRERMHSLTLEASASDAHFAALKDAVSRGGVYNFDAFQAGD